MPPGHQLREWSAVVVGAILGTLARWQVDVAIAHEVDEFATSTFVVNVGGALLLGVAVGAGRPRRAWLRAGATSGFLGTFTTLSALSSSTVLLVEASRPVTAVVYLAASVLAGLAAAAAGLALGRRIDRQVPG